MRAIDISSTPEFTCLFGSKWKRHFAMIRQLSSPTCFKSLSAADTRWTDLLWMLAKLNDGIVYSEKEVDDLS